MGGEVLRALIRLGLHDAAHPADPPIQVHQIHADELPGDHERAPGVELTRQLGGYGSHFPLLMHRQHGPVTREFPRIVSTRIKILQVIRRTAVAVLTPLALLTSALVAGPCMPRRSS